ncbi:hypothetical protein GCM10028793_61430 [Nocardiopsis oceani]
MGTRVRVTGLPGNRKTAGFTRAAVRWPAARVAAWIRSPAWHWPRWHFWCGPT